MRIKFNDKIYRLKEIESGVDSLMEMVEVQKYKNGDFVYEDGRIMIVKSYPNMYHANAYPEYPKIVSYNAYYGVDFSSPTFRHATEEEKQLLIDALKKDGKRWNADKKCIEDIPKRKFKAGDKVKIKDGISSKTHWNIAPSFTSTMDKFIGKELTVKGYSSMGWVVSYGGGLEYEFAEDWLEPWSDEPEVGDWVIFWDYIKVAKIGMLTDIRPDELDKYVVDHQIGWNHAVKWDGTIDHLEKIRSGKV